MKKSIIIIAGILASAVVLYAISWVSVFTGKVYTTSEAASPDTSSTISLKYYDKAYLLTSITGSDSVKVKIYIDGYFNGKWDLDILDDSLIVDNGTGDYTKFTEIRGIAVGVGGYESIRVRNNISSGAADDSSSALSYTQKIILR